MSSHWRRSSASDESLHFAVLSRRSFPAAAVSSTQKGDDFDVKNPKDPDSAVNRCLLVLKLSQGCFRRHDLFSTRLRQLHIKRSLPAGVVIASYNDVKIPESAVNRRLLVLKLSQGCFRRHDPFRRLRQLQSALLRLALSLPQTTMSRSRNPLPTEAFSSWIKEVPPAPLDPPLLAAGKKESKVKKKRSFYLAST